ARGPAPARAGTQFPGDRTDRRRPRAQAVLSWLGRPTSRGRRGGRGVGVRRVGSGDGRRPRAAAGPLRERGPVPDVVPAPSAGAALAVDRAGQPRPGGAAVPVWPGGTGVPELARRDGRAARGG